MRYWSRCRMPIWRRRDAWLERKLAVGRRGLANLSWCWTAGHRHGGGRCAARDRVHPASRPLGQGPGGEAMAAVIAHIFATQPVPALTAEVDPRNAASLRLLDRLGFVETGRAQRTFLLGDEWCDSVYLRLDRPMGLRWLRRLACGRSSRGFCQDAGQILRLVRARGNGVSWRAVQRTSICQPSSPCVSDCTTPSPCSQARRCPRRRAGSGCVRSSLRRRRPRSRPAGPSTPSPVRAETGKTPARLAACAAKRSRVRSGSTRSSLFQTSNMRRGGLDAQGWSGSRPHRRPVRRSRGG